MIVRIRFGPGRLVSNRAGKNGRAARMLASLLSLFAISFGILGFWRLGQDLDFLGNFVFPSGLLSHWQVWIAAAAATQYACWRLTGYSKLAGSPTVEEEAPETNDADDPTSQEAAARV